MPYSQLKRDIILLFTAINITITAVNNCRCAVYTIKCLLGSLPVVMILVRVDQKGQLKSGEGEMSISHLHSKVMEMSVYLWMINELNVSVWQ